MKQINEFFKKNLFTIVVVFMLFTFFKSCGDKNELSKLRKEVELFNKTTYKKGQLDLRLQIEGLKSEKRMIQATDRKIYDVNRENEIEKELKILQEKFIKNEKLD